MHMYLRRSLAELFIEIQMMFEFVNSVLGYPKRLYFSVQIIINVGVCFSVWCIYLSVPSCHFDPDVASKRTEIFFDKRMSAFGGSLAIFLDLLLLLYSLPLFYL